MIDDGTPEAVPVLILIFCFFFFQITLGAIKHQLAVLT